MAFIVNKETKQVLEVTIEELSFITNKEAFINKVKSDATTYDRLHNVYNPFDFSSYYIYILECDKPIKVQDIIQGLYVELPETEAIKVLYGSNEK